MEGLPLYFVTFLKNIMFVLFFLFQTFRNDLQLKWGGYLAIASMLPNVTFLLLNGFLGHKIPNRPKILGSLVLLMICFIFTGVMVVVSDWKVFSCDEQLKK